MVERVWVIVQVVVWVLELGLYHSTFVAINLSEMQYVIVNLILCLLLPQQVPKLLLHNFQHSLDQVSMLRQLAMLLMPSHSDPSDSPIVAHVVRDIPQTTAQVIGLL